MHMTFYHTMKFTWKKVSALCEYRFNLQKANKHGTEAKLIDIQRKRGYQGLGKGEMGKYWSRVTSFQLCKMSKFWRTAYINIDCN